jgi:Ca2+-binding RTX toxin-like protein
VQQIELDSGMTQVNVDIRLEQPTVLQVTLDYATSNLTATDGVDYIGTSGSLTFAPGETQKTISFMIIGDTILEPNEEVFVNITNANDDLGNLVPSIDGQVGGGVITILNDEVSVSISDASAMEGMDLDFTVTLAHPVALPVTIDFATFDDTALGGSDYVSDSGTLTFTAGETTKILSISSIADSSFETDETFTVQLSNPQRNLIPNGTISDPSGTGTILNDEPPPDVWRIVRNGANIDVSLNGNPFTSVDFAATTNLTIVGDTRNEFQQLTINGSPTGTFVLDLDGVLTNAIPIASSASFIQNELANLGNVGTGNVNVSDGATAGTFVIEFTGALAATDISTLAVDNTGLAGGTVTAISDIDGAVVTNDDLFIVDFTSGNPVPVNGLIVNGGNHIGGDGLEIRDSSGSTFGNVTYTPSGTNAGGVQLDGNTINFISLEQPVIDTTDADNRTLEFEAVFGNADHGLRLTNDFSINGNSLLRSTAGPGFVDVSFSNPNNSLTINAGPGNNSVTGDPVDSNFTATLNINGEAGDDNIDLSTLNAPAIISGGIGNDAIVGGMNNDLVMGDDGNDMVDGGGGNDTVGGGLGDDNVFGGDGDDTVSGGNGNDTLNGDAGDDVVDGQDGNDEVSGGSGNDTLTTTLGNDTLNGGSGNDMLQGSQNDDVLNGDSGNDTLLAGLGNDVLDGGAGNDSVFGQGGNDTVAGGAGNDSVDGGDGQDVLLVTSGNDTLNGGSDIDQVRSTVDADQVLTDTQLAGIGVSDHLSVEQFLLIGGPSGNQIDARGYTLGSVTVQGMGGPDTIFGSQGDDSLEGGDGIDVIEGADGDDVLVGNSGNDILDGKAGNDTIRGGGGDDFITGSSGDDSLLGQSGKDTLRGSTGNDVLRGDSENDSLSGGDGLDTLFGGNGADTLDGQDGNDNLKGEDGDDSLMGSRGNDTLDGGAGDDTLRGGADNDRMLGRAGRDLLDGGLGDDKGFAGADSDVLVIGQGSDTLNGQGGLDDSVSITGDATQGDIFEVNNSTSRILIRRVNLATFEAIVGGIESLSFNLMGGDDSVIFQSLENTTLARVDIIAGTGNDNIDASAVLSITNFRVDGDEGDDTIQTGVGSDTINGGLGDDEIRTNNGNDVIRGDEGNDFIAAGRGRDLIFGGVGNDKIFGGGGSDMIFGENGDDDIRAQGGHDTVDAGDGNDYVDASSGNDSVFGGKGFDTIAGGSGDDTLDGGVNNDILNGGSGNDRIIGGRGNDGLSGLTGNDTLIGNSGKDSLIGGDGNDFLYGGSGRDILSGGKGADLINGQGSDRDTVQGGSGGDGGSADTGDIFIATIETEINEEFSFFADWIDDV